MLGRGARGMPDAPRVARADAKVPAPKRLSRDGVGVSTFSSRSSPLSGSNHTPGDATKHGPFF